MQAHEALEASGVCDPGVMLQHGRMLLALRRPRVAVNLLLQAAALKPEMSQTHALLASAFRTMAM